MSTADEFAAELSAVEIHYGPRASIGPISAAVRPGAVLGLIGMNGSGKTSLLRALCALQPVDAGHVRVYGEPVVAGEPVPGLGAMIEEPRFYPWLSARENLVLAAGGRDAWRARIRDVIAAVGLTDAADVRVAEFSQGMRQRLGLARALLGDPRLLVLDEPTNGLDTSAMAQMRELIAGWASRGTAVVVTSHLMSEVEAVADDVLVLNAGELLLNVSMADVLDRWGSVSEMYQRTVMQPA